MTLCAIPAVTRETYLVEVEYAPRPVYGEVLCQFLAGVNPVNHKFKVDRLRRHVEGASQVRRDLGGGVHVGRVMAERAELRRAPPPAAVEGYLTVTHVTL